MSTEWLIASIAVFLAGSIRGFSGFGSAMVIIPTLSILFGTHAAATVSIMAETLASLGLIRGALRKADWSAVWPMAVSGIAMVPVGIYVLATVEPALVTRAMSVVVVVAALLLLSGWQWSGKSMVSKGVGAGMVSGALTGIGGMGGPPVVLYFLSSRFKVDIGRASCITYLSLVQLVTLGIYIFSGLLDGETLQISSVLMAPFTIGLVLGNLGFRDVDPGMYRAVVLTFLLMVGLTTLLISLG